jgi:hypothetical protein
MQMLQSRRRTMLLSLLAMVLVGSFAASTAYAEAGPFCHHRNVGEKGEGLKLGGDAEGENANGTGGEQILKATIGTTPIEIISKDIQIKIQIYNGPDQCQIKISIQYHNPKLVKPVIAECETEIGVQNKIQVKLHAAWKWNGTTKQLEEQPQKEQQTDWLATTTDLHGTTSLPKGEFFQITYRKCGPLTGKVPIKGTERVWVIPEHVEEFKTKFKFVIQAGKWQQHYWSGKQFIGGETGLEFGGNPLDLTGEGELTTEKQELALFEK